MAVTTNLGLAIFDTASGSSTTFLTYRLAQSGNSSNMYIIDNFAAQTNGSLTLVKGGTIYDIDGTQISSNYFEGSNAGITGYNTNLKINLKADASISGSASININSYGIKKLMKVNTGGSIVDLASGDISINKYNQFVYNGTYFVVMNGTISASVVPASSFATTGSVANRHLVIYSGSSGSQVQDGYITVDTSGNLNLGGSQIQNYSESISTTSGCGTKTFDWSIASFFEFTITGGTTISFSNLKAGRSITVMMIQGGSGSCIATWPTLNWTGGSPMVLSTAVGARDIVSFLVDSSGSSVYGFPAGLDMK